VSIDQDLNIERKRYVFKPSMKIDSRTTKVHGFDDNFFEKNSDLYGNFTKHDAKAINN